MMHVRSSGIMLGQQCLWNYEWCRNENTGHYSTGYFTEINKEIFQEKRNYSEVLSQHINTNNPQLCSNNTFWKQHSCTLYDSGGKVLTYGHRCTGAVQQCVVPWFTWRRGEAIGGWEQSCKDKSDQIFPVNITCHQYNEHLVQEHNRLFCKTKKTRTQWAYFRLDELSQEV